VDIATIYMVAEISTLFYATVYVYGLVSALAKMSSLFSAALRGQRRIRKKDAQKLWRNFQIKKFGPNCKIYCPALSVGNIQLDKYTPGQKES
jgi:hypothetical protein